MHPSFRDTQAGSEWDQRPGRLRTLSLGVVDSSSSSSEGGDSLVGVMLPSLSLSPPPSPARPEQQEEQQWTRSKTLVMHSSHMYMHFGTEEAFSSSI